jgi:hypothetical protein
MIGSQIKITAKPKRIQNYIKLKPIEDKKIQSKINYQFGTGLAEIIFYNICSDTAIKCEISSIQSIKLLGKHKLELTLLLDSRIYGTTLLFGACNFIKIVRCGNKILGLHKFLTFYPTRIYDTIEAKLSNYGILESQLLRINSNLEIESKSYNLNGCKYITHNDNKIIIAENNLVSVLNSNFEVLQSGELCNPNLKINHKFMINSNLQIYDFTFNLIKKLDLSYKEYYLCSENLYLSQSHTLEIYDCVEFKLISQIAVSNIIHISYDDNTIFYANNGIYYICRCENWKITHFLGDFKNFQFGANFDCSTLLISEDKNLNIFRKDKEYLLLHTIICDSPIKDIKLSTIGNFAIIKTSDKLHLLK